MNAEADDEKTEADFPADGEGKKRSLTLTLQNLSVFSPFLCFSIYEKP